MAGPTQQNLIDLEQDVTHVAEVATGKAGGVVGGADITTSTNRLGGVRKTLPEAIAELEASGLRGDLANNTDPAKGVALSGYSDSLAYPDGTVGGALIAQAGQISSLGRGFVSSPAFLEQHLSGFFGRGMLTSEVINIATEQSMASASAGASVVDCADKTNFIQGGCCTIKHDNGKYETYAIIGKSGSGLDISPRLKYDCLTTSARIERTWYNRAHPGKFYIRQLAQRIANSSELDAAMPSSNRVLFSNFANTTTENTLTAIGGVTGNYYDSANLGTLGTDSPVRFTLAKSAYVEGFDAIGDGVETALFDAGGVQDVVVRVAMMQEGGLRQYKILVVGQDDVVVAEYLAGDARDNRAYKIHSFGASLRNKEKIKVRIESISATTGGFLSVAQIDVFESNFAAGPIVAKRNGTVVVLGDSWVAGDMGNTPEREPMTTQLALELPCATIVNAGVGGNAVWNMLARFDTDVAPYKPDYVVVNTGTNESYNPASGTFYPNAVDYFTKSLSILIGKIVSIGARPIIIGVPALAQSDADVPALPEWQLNDRARMYAQYVFEWQSNLPVIKTGSNANGYFVKYEDGTMICAHTVSVTTPAAQTNTGVEWEYPKAFISTPKITASCSNFSTGQVLTVGTMSGSETSALIMLRSESGAVTLPIDCVAVGRWKL